MHYDEKYFEWQREMGAFGGIAELFKFENHINENDSILDFGCGGGFLLKNINCAKRIGVEINESARKIAKENGIEVYKTLEELADNCVDKIISNHVLEHVYNPLETLTILYKKLKINGLIIFVVPHEDTKGEWKKNDINMHLYTWNQITLGNLFETSGFEIIEVTSLQHQWPPNFMKVQAKSGWEKFHKICCKHAKKNNNYQIKILAKKV